METTVREVLYPRRDEVILALLYCTCAKGAMCGKCPFAGYGAQCSYILYTDTVRMLYEKEEEA